MDILSGIVIFILALFILSFFIRIFGWLLGLVFSLAGTLILLYFINQFFPLEYFGVPMIVLAGIIMAIRAVTRR